MPYSAPVSAGDSQATGTIFPVLSFKGDGFHGLTLRRGPCRPSPPSYMRLTIAIREHLIFGGLDWCAARAQPTCRKKEGYEDNGKGHWDRSRHHEFVRRRNGWQNAESHRKRRRDADDAVDCRIQR